jgi:DNA primase
VLARARPLIDVLFEREWGRGDWSTPERRARLEQDLRGLSARVEDVTVRNHYRRDLARRLETAFGHEPGGGRRSGTAGRGAAQGRQAWRGPPGVWGPRVGRPGVGQGPGSGFNVLGRANASPSLRKSAIVAGEGSAAPNREALLLLALLNHPWLAEEQAETVAGLTFTSPALSRLRDAILSAQALENSLDRISLRSHLSKIGAGKVLGLVERAITHKCDKFAEPEAERTEVEHGWRHALALHERSVGLRRSLEAAERAWHEDRSEDAYARICELHHELEHLIGSEAFDRAAGDDPRP